MAYRMLGSVSEAEDVVQEALLRLHHALDSGEEIESPAAYLSTITTRLAIDELRSARVRRERYVGEWLPEPLVTDDENVVLWVDIASVLGLVETAAGMADESIPRDVRDNLEPLNAVVFSQEPSFEEGTMRLFLSVR